MTIFATRRSGARRKKKFPRVIERYRRQYPPDKIRYIGTDFWTD